MNPSHSDTLTNTEVHLDGRLEADPKFVWGDHRALLVLGSKKTAN